MEERVGVCIGAPNKGPVSVGTEVLVEAGADLFEELLFGEFDARDGDRRRRGDDDRCAMTTATKHVRSSLLLAVVVIPSVRAVPHTGALTRRHPRNGAEKGLRMLDAPHPESEAT